jgi:pectate lyase
VLRFKLAARRAVLALVMTLAGCAALAIGAAPAQAQSPWGTIGNYHSGKCLDNPGFATGNVQLDQWSCNYGTNQEFRELHFKTVVLNGVQYPLYVIQNQSSRKCLDLYRGSSTPGTKIIQYACNSSDDAQWWYLEQTDIAGWFLLVNQASGFRDCITVTNDSQANGAKVESWPCTSAANGDHAMYWEPHTFG